MFRKLLTEIQGTGKYWIFLAVWLNCVQSRRRSRGYIPQVYLKSGFALPHLISQSHQCKLLFLAMAVLFANWPNVYGFSWFYCALFWKPNKLQKLIITSQVLTIIFDGGRDTYLRRCRDAMLLRLLMSLRNSTKNVNNLTTAKLLHTLYTFSVLKVIFSFFIQRLRSTSMYLYQQATKIFTHNKCLLSLFTSISHCSIG